MRGPSPDYLYVTEELSGPGSPEPAAAVKIGVCAVPGQRRHDTDNPRPTRPTAFLFSEYAHAIESAIKHQFDSVKTKPSSEWYWTGRSERLELVIRLIRDGQERALRDLVASRYRGKAGMVVFPWEVN